MNMEEKINCFVIIGYGKKASYANGKHRTLDLDETYSLLLKPVFEELGISCYRAIDKNLNGSIDKVMLQEIKNATIALADISTLNANVMWELGVRHALKPHHTIMICEKEQMGSIPFDVNHFVIHEYTHSEEGIPYREVERFKTHLKDVITGILKEEPKVTDSPVHTFLSEISTGKAISEPETDDLLGNESFASLMEKAESAKKSTDFKKALEYFTIAKKCADNNMTLKSNLPLIISRQAFCTYKIKEPNEFEAFIQAKIILEELKPLQSQDTEVLGLSGAINKRLYEITAKPEYIENAISFYEKGFQLKQDYYNGINTVFMLYKKASILSAENKDFEDVKLKADYLRNCVLNNTLELESAAGFEKTEDAIWVLNTIAEAYNYKDHLDMRAVYEAKAAKMAEEKKDAFAISSYEEQKKKIEEIKTHLK
jgi:hypothetical protein